MQPQRRLSRKARRALGRAKPVDGDVPRKVKAKRMKRLRGAMDDTEFQEFLRWEPSNGR